MQEELKQKVQEIIKELRTIELLKANQGTGDTERQHYNADNILCELLKKLGAENVVKQWEKVHRWYA